MRPVFSGDEEVAGFGIVGDAVEDLGAVGWYELVAEAGEVEPAGDFAVSSGNAGDALGLIDIGEDLAVDVFELVELVDGVGAVGDGESFLDGEILGAAEGELVAAVAHDEVGAVVSEAPAFALVGVGADGLEGVWLEDVGGGFLPGEDPELLADEGESLAEDGLGEWALAEDFSGGGV